MKLKITDERLHELAADSSDEYGMIFNSHEYKKYIDGYSIGFRAAESHHQATVDKLLQIVELHRGALDKMTDHGLGHYEDCDYMEYEEDESICNCKVGKVNSDCVNILLEADKMLKELNDGK